MDVSQYAAELIAGVRLADKLLAPAGIFFPQDGLTMGLESLPRMPGRPPNLQIVHGKFAKVPPIAGMRDPHQRVRILHALANHELQAVELFAWALLAFADAPLPFRRGLLAILADEQRHLEMYIDRMADMGHQFGDFAVTGHFWHKLDDYRSPLHFICAMGLTFENANLDFAQEYAAMALRIGDHETAAVLNQVHQEEISHVHFAWVWLQKLAPQGTAWQTFIDHLDFPLGPHRARGKTFDQDSRRRAGLSAEFIAQLQRTEAKRPSGESR
jgi:uncharacterized ferritin-like protein (DUF455 family)